MFEENVDLFMDQMLAIDIRDQPMEKIDALARTLHDAIHEDIIVDYLNYDTVRGFIYAMNHIGHWPYIITIKRDNYVKLSACTHDYFHDDEHRGMRILKIDEFLKEGENECVSVSEFEAIF